MKIPTVVNNHPVYWLMMSFSVLFSIGISNIHNCDGTVANHSFWLYLIAQSVTAAVITGAHNLYHIDAKKQVKDDWWKH